MSSDSADDERDEKECREAFDAEDYVRTATLAIERYGREIMAFLLARLRRRSDAEEVFAMFAEKLWIGLPQFEWRCSLKTWCYRIARNAANDYASAAYNRTGRHIALSQHEALAQLVDRTRTATTLYRQTGVREQIRKLRESLAPDDQMLLMLRVDKRMDFREIAVAMGNGETLEVVQIERDAARLRKRFERVKERLREMAREAGLI